MPSMFTYYYMIDIIQKSSDVECLKIGMQYLKKAEELHYTGDLVPYDAQKRLSIIGKAMEPRNKIIRKLKEIVEKTEGNC